VTANGNGVFLEENSENTLKLIVIMVSQNSNYNKRKKDYTVQTK
jgi:hypothetical protein